MPGSTQVTCSYCGTTSFLPQKPAAPTTVAPAPNPTPWVLIGLGIGAFVLISTAVCVFLLVGSGSSEHGTVSVVATPTATTTVAAVPASAATALEPAVSAIKIQNDFAPLLADVNADGHHDVVVAISTSGAAATAEHYAAFDGVSGRELSRSAALGDTRSDTLPVIPGRRLITASRSGQLIGYGLANGSQQWTTAEKVRRVFVTAFALADGTRRWTTPLAEDISSLVSLSTSAERVFILANERLLILDAAKGKAIAAIGANPTR
jgi:hypothetical protein